MSASNSYSPKQIPTTFNERLSEQLINCLNVQTNVIQNLSQYSQHISLQLIEIKNAVEILTNRVLALQQQQNYNVNAHYGQNHYPASYYPQHAPPPSIPGSYPPSSLAPMPQKLSPHAAAYPIPAQFNEQRPSIMTSTTTPANVSFFSQLGGPHVQPPVSQMLPTNPNTGLPSFTPNMAMAQPPASKPSTMPSGLLPTPTTQSIFTNAKGSMSDTTPKVQPPIPKFATKETTSNPNEKPFGTGQFVFGTNASNIFGANAPTVFGTNASNIFSTKFGDPLASTHVGSKVDQHADDDGDEGDEDESYEPNHSFTPLVQLSAVEVKTGEEDEDILFCERAKLYRFDKDSNQMKERGIGEMKILQHKTTKLCRILMRREQVLKLCANHKITADIELKPHQGSANAFLWSAMDFADGEPKHETLCVRFKTESQAKNFAKLFNEAKETNKKYSSESSSSVEVSTKDENAKSKSSDDEVISIGEVKPSAEQADLAKRLQLPSTFFLYENKEPCKGCAGCEDESTVSVSNENKTSSKPVKDQVKVDTKAKDSSATPSSSAPKVPLSSSENIKVGLTNGENSKPPVELQKQTSKSKDEKAAVVTPSTPVTAAVQQETKPPIFGNLNGNSPSVFGGTSNLNKNGDSVFGGAGTTKASGTSGFSFSGFGASSSAATSFTGFSFGTQSKDSSASNTSNFSFAKTAESNSTDKPLFGSTTGFSFADLAKQSPGTLRTDTTKTNGNDQRVFAGQGSLVFGNKMPLHTATTGNNNDDDDGEGGGDDDSYEPNVSFKPIVQLSAVEVKTGEEDEDILFCERAKLYRFDKDSNQMKERGIGEMKILQHKTTKLCRILMRREQVLKLCANHKITADIELKQHQGSANAFLWSAMDFADGEPKHETLCVRFKTESQAKNFAKQFTDAQKQSNKVD